MDTTMVFGMFDAGLVEGARPVLRGLGIVGACLYLANYTMLQLRVHSGDSIRFTALNTLAAALVLAGLTTDFNPGAAIIQIAWIVLGTIGMTIRASRGARSARAAARAAVAAPVAAPVPFGPYRAAAQR